MEEFDGFLYHITRYRPFAVGEKFPLLPEILFEGEVEVCQILSEFE